MVVPSGRMHRLEVRRSASRVTIDLLSLGLHIPELSEGACQLTIMHKLGLLPRINLDGVKGRDVVTRIQEITIQGQYTWQDDKLVKYSCPMHGAMSHVDQKPHK